MVNFRIPMPIKVATMGEQDQVEKKICGCPAATWLEFAGILKILFSCTLIVTGSSILIVWQVNPDQENFNYNQTDPITKLSVLSIDDGESKGIIFQQRQWTKEHMEGIIIFGVMFSIISLLMGVILVWAAFKKIGRLICIWPVWVFVYLIVGWTSALFILHVNWVIILILVETTQFQLFTIFLVVVLDREIKTEGTLQNNQIDEGQSVDQ